jgi:opacity protein-like surface antigen
MAIHRSKAAASRLLLMLLFLVLLIPANMWAQQAQPYVGRFDAFTGFSYMASPDFNLYQRGFNGEFGVNVTRWLALGGDFSVLDGNTSLFPSELKPSLQAELGAELQQLAQLGAIPPGYVLYVPFNAKTYTYAAGPQINFRQLKAVTFFVRPDLGAIHEDARLHPRDQIQTLVVQALAPGGNKTDTTYFYGVGGGFDINASKHVALRVTVDYVHTFLFDDLLKDSRNTVRLSVGPTFRFGKNVE